MNVETISRRTQNLISSLEHVAVRMKSMVSGPGLFKEDFSCAEMLSLCRKNYCCYENMSDKFQISSKDLNKRVLEDSGVGPMAKYRRVLVDAINFTSTKREFRIINHMVATYEQTKKGLSYFYPKRQVQDDYEHLKFYVKLGFIVKKLYHIVKFKQEGKPNFIFHLFYSDNNSLIYEIKRNSIFF